MPKSGARSTVAKPPPPLFEYIHAVDLLLTRVQRVLENAGDLVDVTLDSYELAHYQVDGRSTYGCKLRSNGCRDPRKKYYLQALEALKLAAAAAVRISDWRHGASEYGRPAESRTLDSAGMRIDVNGPLIEMTPSRSISVNAFLVLQWCTCMHKSPCGANAFALALHVRCACRLCTTPNARPLP